jgi:TonB family protein
LPFGQGEATLKIQTALASATLALLLAKGVQAAETPIVDPGWRGVGDLGGFYPERAIRMQISGWAKLRCVVSEYGQAKDCVVLGESPSGYGFGKAALKIIAHGQFDPVAHGETTAGRTIIKTLSFSVGSAAPNKLAAQPSGGRTPSALGDSAAQDEWSVQPTKAEIARMHPRNAEAYGMADVYCQAVSSNGALSNCAVHSESPAGQGFGSAALSLYRKYRLRDVRPPKLRVSFFISWIRPGSNEMPVGTSFTMPHGLTPEWRPVFVPIVSVLDPMKPGGIVKYQSVVFVAAPDKTKIEAARPPGPKGDAAVGVQCDVAPSGALAGCVTTAYRGADASYIKAATSLLPLYRVSKTEIAAFAAEPRASFHVNWSP